MHMVSRQSTARPREPPCYLIRPPSHSPLCCSRRCIILGSNGVPQWMYDIGAIVLLPDHNDVRWV